MRVPNTPTSSSRVTTIATDDATWGSYQRTVDYPNEWAKGHHVLLDIEEQVTVRWEQVEAALRHRQLT